MFRLMLAMMLFASAAFAYDIEQLIKDATAHHAKSLASFDDMKLEYTGKFMAPGEGGESSITSTMYRKGEKWRMEGSMDMKGGKTTVNGKEMSGTGGLETVVLFDGKDTWTTAMGMKMKLPKDQAGSQTDYAEYWKEPPAGSKVVGEETVGGRAAWLVEYPENKMSKEPVKMWIDKEHFVHLQSTTMLSGKTIKSVFSDLKTVHGDFVIPYHAEVFSDDTKTMTVDLTKVEINKGLSDDLFNESILEGGSMDMDIEKLMKQAEEMQKKYGGGSK
jgi:outer membrane lipoprotein-sorting protein